MLGVTTTVIASAFSFAGFLIPPLLTPLLEVSGWRALWLVIAAAIGLHLPFCLWILRPGPINLKSHEEEEEEKGEGGGSAGGTFMVAIFGIKLYEKVEKQKIRAQEARGRRAAYTGEHGEQAAVRKARSKSFTGGRLSLAPGSAADPELVLASLAKHEAIMGHEEHAKPPEVTLVEALRMPKFWALVTVAITFFLYGGALNLHLPSILQAEAGKSAAEASTIYSYYNLFGVCGKVLTGVVLSTPALKRSEVLYVPFPLCFLLSHFLLLDFFAPGGVGVTSSTALLTAFSAIVGVSYGFCASMLQVLVKEYFGIVELAKIQPIVYGCVIVGCMGGMFVPGLILTLFGSYIPFLLCSLGTTSLTFSMFLFLYYSHPIRPAPPGGSEVPHTQRKPGQKSVTLPPPKNGEGTPETRSKKQMIAFAKRRASLDMH